MHGEGVSRAFIVQDLTYLAAHILVVLAGIETQNGSQLLVGIRMSTANAVLLGNQNPCRSGHPVQAGQISDDLDAATDNLGIHGAVCPEDEAAQLSTLGFVQEVGALCLHLLPNSIHHVLIADNGLLRRTDGAVVEC